MDPINLKFLMPDEFMVECLVRKIDGNPSSKFDMLGNLMGEEVNNPALRPFKPHKAASKNPDREIRKCLSKISEFRDWFVDQKEGEQDDTQFIPVKIRLNHVIMRLERLSKSTKRYKSDCLNALKEAQLLQTHINKGTDNVDLLNESIKFIEENINVKVEDLSSSEDEFSDVESVFSQPTVRSTPQKFNHRVMNNHMAGSSNNDNVVNPAVSNAVFDQFSNLHLDNQTTNFNQIHHTGQQHTNNNIFGSFPNSNQHQYFGPTQSLPLFSTQPTNSFVTDAKHQLSKWRIEFDGTTDGVAIERFLFRVEHLARTYRVPDNTVKDQFWVLLKGIASNWYWCYLERNPNVSWFQLKAAIIERFQDRRTDDDIRRLIDSRKQRSCESFIEYYNEILALTLRFRNPIPDSDILRILRYNMNIGLQNHLADQEIDSINTLVRRCVALEDMWKRHNFVPEKFCKSQYVSEVSGSVEVLPTKSFVTPDPFKSNFIPDTNPKISGPTSINQNYNNYVNPNSDQFNNIISTNQIDAFNQNFNTNQPNYFICWNCRDVGHTFLNCPVAQRRLFCHGCGTDGFSKINCPKCSCTGNENSRTQTAALNTPRINQQQRITHATTTFRDNSQ